MSPAHTKLFGRILAIAALCAAFVVMASVFSPYSSRAWDGPSEPRPWPTTDPHEGLRQIGTFEHIGHEVHVYSTDNGPRYSVYVVERNIKRELGVLLSEEQMEHHHPDLPIRGVEFNGRQLMLAPTDREY